MVLPGEMLAAKEGGVALLLFRAEDSSETEEEAEAEIEGTITEEAGAEERV